MKRLVANVQQVVFLHIIKLSLKIVGRCYIKLLKCTKIPDLVDEKRFVGIVIENRGMAEDQVLAAI